MPVTELAWIPSSTPGVIAQEFIDIGPSILVTQGNWLEANAGETGPRGPAETRGAAYYRQLEDRGVALITCHWHTVAQHYQWIQSDENKSALAGIAPFLDMASVKLFHVDDVEAFPAETLALPFLSVVRLKVEGESESTKRAEVQKKWKSVKDLLEHEAGSTHRAGWMIEKEMVDGKEIDQYVIVGAWKDGEALKSFIDGTWKNAEAWKAAWKTGGLVSAVEPTSYEQLG
ncbi:hypothetical protein F5Y16DRAFT_363364 [Xylariaceae sp. FL0255]|nr:hypothetical protein F5Y16DRAFT_363364 [Xylariaceae sp. FL0255]